MCIVIKLIALRTVNSAVSRIVYFLYFKCHAHIVRVRVLVFIMNRNGKATNFDIIFMMLINFYHQFML